VATGLIIGLSGRIASGKSYIGEYLEQHYGFMVLRYRTLLERIIMTKHMQVSRTTLQAMGLEMGEKIGYDGLTRLLLADALPDQNYTVDGVRHLSAFEFLRNRYQNQFALFFRDLDQIKRFELFNARAKPDLPLTLEEFRAIDEAPVEQEIQELKARADLLLPYVPDLISLHISVDSFLGNQFGLKRKN
jgi:hypothetical protein